MNTQEFLQALYNGADGYAEIRLLHKSNDWKLAQKIYRPASTIHTGNFDVLREMNDEYHIYHRVNVSADESSRKDSITHITALYVDIDDSSDEAYERLQDMAIPPNAVVASGGGYHGYWLLDTPLPVQGGTGQEVERTMQGMIVAYGDGADDKAKDITRILRTPGFYNIKGKYDTPPMCELMYLDDDMRVTFQQMHRTYAALGTPARPTIKRTIPKEAIGNDLPEYVHNYIQHGAPEGERNKRLYVSARFYLDAGRSQMDAEQDLLPRALADGLPHSEARAAINSAFSNTPNYSTQLPKHMQAVIAVEDGRQ